MKTRILSCSMDQAEQHLSPEELAGLISGRCVITNVSGEVRIEAAPSRAERNFLGQIVIPESRQWGARE